MKKFLEKIIHTIVPHEKNGNIPHILQAEFMFVIVVFVGILFYFNQNNSNIIKGLNLSATVYPSVLADLANKDRAISNVPSLAWSPTLENAAKLKATDMLTNNYFAHTSPTGVTPWYWLKKVNYNFSYAGENLAVDFTESANVEQAWINSPKHKENILNSHFTEVGIATVDGVFEGKNTTFVVEFFGKPSTLKTIEKTTTVKKLAVDNTAKTVTPSVAGVSTENSVKENNINVIQETKDFIIAKDDSVIPEETPVVASQASKPMSTWYERFMVSPTNTIKIIYSVIFSLILLAVLLVLFKEYKKHHAKHIAMGAVIMAVIATLMYIVSTSAQAFF